MFLVKYQSIYVSQINKNTHLHFVVLVIHLLVCGASLVPVRLGFL